MFWFFITMSLKFTSVDSQESNLKYLKIQMIVPTSDTSIWAFCGPNICVHTKMVFDRIKTFKTPYRLQQSFEI